MRDLFYFLLGLSVFVLPIYLIVKFVKKIINGEKNKIFTIKEKKENIDIKKKVSAVKEKKEATNKKANVGKEFFKLFLITFGSIIGFIVLITALALIATGGVSDEYDNSSKQVEIIKQAVSVDNDKAIAIEKIFKSVGIKNFESITHDEILDEEYGENSTGYRIKTSFSNNVILYLDSLKNVVSIRWADKDFYSNNQPILNFSDYLITSAEQSDYNIDAQDRIKKLLKSPSSAKFPNITKWKISKDNGTVIVQSYVDSQNSFGAMLRSEFQIKYAKDGTILSLIFDGKEYIK